MIDKFFIAELRGCGDQTKCDWCGREFPIAQLIPEEAGEWICHECDLKSPDSLLKSLEKPDTDSSAP